MGHVLTQDENAAASQHQSPRNHVEKGWFSSTIATQNCQKIMFINRQIHMVKDGFDIIQTVINLNGRFF